MFSKYAQTRIDNNAKWANELKSSTYNLANAYDKLLSIDTFDSSINISLISLEISYNLKEDENLMFTANQLLENIDEALNLKELNIDKADYLTEMQIFRFDCKLQTGERLEISIYFSDSKNCSVEYEDVMTKKAVLTCD